MCIQVWFVLNQRLTISVKDFKSFIALNWFGNMFQSWEPFTEIAFCPCEVLRNPILQFPPAILLVVLPVSPCLITKLHKTEGALLFKHLKYAISLKYDSDANDLSFYPLFLGPDYTASQFFLVKESLAWVQTVIQYEMRDKIIPYM